jgi:PhzF family phenazine biosynthesis protein
VSFLGPVVPAKIVGSSQIVRKGCLIPREVVVGVPLLLVDAFTDRAFAGNPAAVCLLAKWPNNVWLQSLAAEMKQSETAYLVRNSDGFDLRWFTPAVEVDLCGHATLASAHALWEEGLVKRETVINFSTRSGILKAAQNDGLIELDFPLKPEEPVEPPANLLPALGVESKYVGKNRFDYLVEVESEAVLRQMTPDFRRLGGVPVRGTIVTSRSSDPRFDFVSRFFAPASGIDEDPVTGSAHCCLADFWRKRLGKIEFLAYQASPRGGVIRVRIAGNRVLLGGAAVTVTKGELTMGAVENTV